MSSQFSFTAANTAPNIGLTIDPAVGQPFDTKVFKPFGGSYIYDPDQGDEITLTIKIDDPAKGTFLGYTVGRYDKETGIYTFKGTSDEARDALYGLWFDPRDRNGVGGIEEIRFTATVVDTAGARSEAATILRVKTTADRPPTISIPADSPVVPDTALGSPFAGIKIADPENAVLTVFVSSSSGGSIFRLESDGTRTAIDRLVGTAAEVQAALRELKYDAPDRNGVGDYIKTLDLWVTVSDGTHEVRQSIKVRSSTEGGTLSTAPILTPPAVKEVTVADTDLARPFANLELTDDSDSVTVLITFDPSKGRMIEDLYYSGGTYDPDTGTFVVTASAYDAKMTLQKLQFDPRARPGSEAGSIETTIFTIKVQDGEHTVTNSDMKVHSVASGSIVPPPPGGNAAPTDLALSAAAIRELSATGTTIGTLSATDAPSSTFTYTLIGDGAGGRFKIDGTQIKVANSLLLDHEQAKAHTIRVKVTDQGGLSFEKDLTLAVTDWVGERAIGSAGKDVLKGGLGHDTLFGGYGNDALTGGTGKDVFVFNTKLGSSKTNKALNADAITDFSVKDDTIWLENKVFTKLGKKGSEKKPAKLNKEFFIIGSKAVEADDYLIYNKKTGALLYDKDGSGKGQAVEIARLSKNLKMTALDFFVI